MVSRAEGEHPQEAVGPLRPRVSVIVPFSGSSSELAQLLQSLEALDRLGDDELIVVDNRRPAALPSKTTPPERIRLHEANAIASPAFARNAGARLASSEWLVFIDADTRPRPGLLDAYFSPPPAKDTAVLAGGILDVATNSTLVARHDVARHRMSQENTLRRDGLPYAQTANCAVRRAAFNDVGGFDDLARTGEDADLCFRLQGAGWKLEERPSASVEHRARRTLRACLAQNVLHGSGVGWLDRRWPGEFPAPGPRWLLVRTLTMTRRALAALIRRDTEEAAFTLLDLAEVSARDLGRLIPNRPPRRG
jgi:GT2 family glycosyltransferase